MTDATFGMVTSSFTLGGFMGSSLANILMDKLGRRKAVMVNAGLVASGGAIMTVANGISSLVVGRCAWMPWSFLPELTH